MLIIEQFAPGVHKFASRSPQLKLLCISHPGLCMLTVAHGDLVHLICFEGPSLVQLGLIMLIIAPCIKFDLDSNAFYQNFITLAYYLDKKGGGGGACA